MPSYTTPRTTVVTDTECFPNYWSIAFKCVDTGRTKHFCQADALGLELDRPAIVKILRGCRVVSFNGIGYDMLMIALAMSGVTNSQLKHANDDIILGGLRSWEFEDKYGVKLPEWLDHIDLMEASPGSPQKPSLKIYAGRLHSKRMQELPFDPDHYLTQEEIEIVDDYHINDLVVTVDKYKELLPQLTLRASMSEQYGVDLRSKSDAQVAEAVIKTEIERITGKKVYKPEIRSGVFRYIPPPFIRYETNEMRAMLDRVVNAKFSVGADGVVRMPEALADASVSLGNSIYRMGIGGLHSSESQVTYRSDDEMLLIDRDVTSYYPNIILGSGLYPKHLGENFLRVYRRIYDRRIAAKKSGDGNTAETLKIVLNGSFGKFGSPYSVLYSPDLMIQTTVGGQLAILMLIERMFLQGFDVVSANTDGFVTRVPPASLDDFNAIIFDWECDTGFATEETRYKALHSRDVNNYLAMKLKFDKKTKSWLDEIDDVKTKGAFAPAGPGQKGAAGMKKNPTCEISTDAAVAWLKDGTPIEQTIRGCTDIRRFVAVRRVTGGAEKMQDYLIPPVHSTKEELVRKAGWSPVEGGYWRHKKAQGELAVTDLDSAYEQAIRKLTGGGPKYIGKAIRYYYATSERGRFINYRSNGNTVPRSQGAKPCMELPDELPDDVDFDWYIREAYAILEDVGAPLPDPSLAGRSGTMFARLESQKTVHIVQLPSGIALCGKGRASLREEWVDYKRLPAEYRLCGKCKREDAL